MKQLIRKILLETKLDISDYDKNLYGDNNPLSPEAHHFLLEWTWNGDILRYYQTNGLSVIPKNVVNELQQYVPTSPIIGYRFFDNIESENLSKTNKLISFSNDAEISLECAFDSCPNPEDMKDYNDDLDVNNRFRTQILFPKKMLVNTISIPNWKNLDLLDEIIYINK